MSSTVALDIGKSMIGSIAEVAVAGKEPRDMQPQSPPCRLRPSTVPWLLQRSCHQTETGRWVPAKRGNPRSTPSVWMPRGGQPPFAGLKYYKTHIETGNETNKSLFLRQVSWWASSRSSPSTYLREVGNPKETIGNSWVFFYTNKNGSFMGWVLKIKKWDDSWFMRAKLVYSHWSPGQRCFMLVAFIIRGGYKPTRIIGGWTGFNSIQAAFRAGHGSSFT